MRGMNLKLLRHNLKSSRKDGKASNESEFEYEENTKSGKRGKMDEVEDTLGRYLFEIEESVVVFHSTCV
ncbi:hypothetical protein YC2023_075803 [Brassica napus]